MVNKNMDPQEKKRLANERRLKAIQEQKLRRQQNGMIKPARVDIELPVKREQKNNIKLFDSDEEDNEDTFNIRPEFEGQNMQLSEMSTDFSSRFELDERFRDDDPLEPMDAEASEEKTKNIKILESILGFEVSEKYPDDKSIRSRRQIERFDPEDEGASKYIKVNDASEESKIKQRKKNKKKDLNESKEEVIPVSKERYIEVSSNLKDLFSSSSSFSLTSKFQSQDDEENKMFDELNNPFQKDNASDRKEQHSNREVKEHRQNNYEAPPTPKDAFEARSAYTFFISGDDSRLKEGVEFFRRQKPLDEIREEWNSKKDRIMEIFRMKKRSQARGYVHKNPTTQGKRTFVKK